MSEQDQSDHPHGTEPGANSTPAADGAGVADSGDRTGAGAPAANQSKTEPIPPGAGDEGAPAQAEPRLPDLDSMNVGAADPQAPNHAAAGTTADRAAAGMDPVPGSEVPAPLSTGAAEAFRAPGSNGSEGGSEQIDTDVATSADRTNPVGAQGADSGPGNAAGVPVVSEDAAVGTSQDSAEVQGTRTPL
jgi:hypothetical protein